MTRVLIVDDQELFRDSLSIIMNSADEIEVTGAVAGVDDALASIEKTKPEVVLMDIRMPGRDGVEGTRLIKNRYPEIKVIVLTTFDDDEYVYGALKYGASGYLLKGCSRAELLEAIHLALSGGAMINPEIATKVIRQFSEMARRADIIQVPDELATQLNESEIKIIRAVGHGLSNREISSTLYLSEGTVRNYISSILMKLELRDRTQLAIWAVQKGMTG
ncbi:MAG: response regulator transcription factor [Solobacterium sp.]|nr:response regulator transcription factor [Solobacterium sp.]MBQ9823629.1 response regulator transcription factor [Solobacterium sp.]